MPATITEFSPAAAGFRLIKDVSDVQAASATTPAPDRATTTQSGTGFRTLATATKATGFSITELLIFLMFLSVALIAIITCFVALASLVQKDSIYHVAERALDGAN